MPLFGGSKNGPSENERYEVLRQAKDEDYTLYEFTTRIEADTERIKLTVNELLNKGMLEVFVIRPDRERLELNLQQATAVLARPQSWAPPDVKKDRFLLKATDKGWRWHEKHWKPHD